MVLLLLRKLHLSMAHLISLYAVMQTLVRILFVVTFRGILFFPTLSQDINKCKHGSY